ncbi:MAG: hypothetical protein JSV62_07500 [Promethearchaeota archaeon]|nr:MAG: hypothetical protein JSV62_07500 [Candidatus Lokiarchaeota archaeon]
MTNKLIGLRLPLEDIKKLEVIAHQNNQSVNSVAKNAIIEWLEIFSRTRQQGMIILGKLLVSNLLELIDVDKLKQFAELTADRKVDFFHFIIGKHPSVNTLDEFIKDAPKILGNKGLMWFDHIEITKEKNSVHFKGVHSLGEKWPQFLLFFFNHIMQQYFNMKLNEENLKHSDNSLYLEYNF